MLPKFLKPTVQVPMVRIGSKKDGGYFIPSIIIKNLKKIIACGLGEDWSFEEDFLKRKKNIKITFYDHTVGTLFWLKYFFKSMYFFFRYGSHLSKVFKFFKYLKFFKNKNVNHIKSKISKITNVYKKEISLKEILKFEKKILLKIDIEGDEYKILKQIILYQKKLN